MFDTGDIVRTLEPFGLCCPMVGVVIACETPSSWAVFWSDGDTTYSENEETMQHHQIIPEQWTPVMMCKYLEILDSSEEHYNETR